MSDKTRAFLLSLTIIAVLVFSAFGPNTIVYADGGTTTDSSATATTTTDESVGTTAEATTAPDTGDATAEATAVPAEVAVEATATPEEVSVAATEVPTEATAEPTTDTTAEATPAPESTEAAAPAEDAAATEEAAPAADTTVLDTVPENTTVTVLDSNGESQPLASQDAADAIATSDPVWCPSTQSAPTPGANGCTDSFNSFDALLTFLATNPTYQGAGTIYVQQGAYTGGESSIDFNNYTLTNISSSDLTVTGGWNPADNTVNSTTPSTFNNIPIIIGSSGSPWGGSLTLSNITLSFTPQTSAPAVPVNGLTLYSAGNITVNNVSVMNAPTDGADLEAGGSVNVINSKFDRNQVTGAKIKSGGSVAVVNSSFSNPINGRRQDTGLDIQQAGSVTLFDVLANNNRVAGASVNATGQVTIGGTVALPDGTCPTGTCGSFFSGTKVIQGSNFGGYGLNVTTTGAITLDRVTANDNFLYGATLATTVMGSNIAITNSIFNANSTASPGFIDDTGLVIHGMGNVALDNVTASNNRLYGAQIDTIGTGTVTINSSEFSNNRGRITTNGVLTDYGHGLWVSSPAGIFLSNVTADGNDLFGAQLISTTGNVDVSFSTFSNTSTGNSNAVGKGLENNSGGSVSLINVVLDNNQTVGADITAANGVTLSGVTATNNGTDGVVVNGMCVLVSGGTYTGNGQYGLNLASSALDLLSAPVFGSNGAGGLFPATPVNCDLMGAGAGTVTGLGASNVFTSLQIAPQNTAEKSGTIFSSTTASDKQTLSGFLSSAKVSKGGALGSIFFGKYGYLYSSSGMQVFAFIPALEGLAKQ